MSPLWSDTVAKARRQADAAMEAASRTPAEREERYEAAMQRAKDAVGASVRSSFAIELKIKARRFLRNPWMLDHFHPQLSLATARQFLAITDHLSEGRQVSPFNVSVLYLITRFLRRIETRARVNAESVSSYVEAKEMA